jgi:hypothetical protein
LSKRFVIVAAFVLVLTLAAVGAGWKWGGSGHTRMAGWAWGDESVLVDASTPASVEAAAAANLQP